MKALCAIFIVLLSSCGTEGDIPLGVEQAGLTGLWRGIYSEKSLDRTKSYEVDLHFKSQGEFVLRHLTMGNSASGTFTEDAGDKSVLMSVRTSSISAFKLTASTYEFKYEINKDGRMEMDSQEARYLLVKQGDSSSPELALDGQWYCPSEEEGFRRFYVESGSYWMTYTAKTGVSFFLRGEVVYETQVSSKDEQKARLTILEVHPYQEITEMTAYLLLDPKTGLKVLELVTLGNTDFTPKDLQSVQCSRVEPVGSAEKGAI
jgi:hypothetical protein